MAMSLQCITFFNVKHSLAKDRAQRWIWRVRYIQVTRFIFPVDCTRERYQRTLYSMSLFKLLCFIRISSPEKSFNCSNVKKYDIFFVCLISPISRWHVIRLSHHPFFKKVDFSSQLRSMVFLYNKQHSRCEISLLVFSTVQPDISRVSAFHIDARPYTTLHLRRTNFRYHVISLSSDNLKRKKTAKLR